MRRIPVTLRAPLAVVAVVSTLALMLAVLVNPSSAAVKAAAATRTVTATVTKTVTATATVTSTVTATATVTQTVTADPSSSAPPTTSATPTPITPLPAQPAGIFYGDPGAWDSTLDLYAHPGAMVVAGRENYTDQGFADVEAGGGSVLVYLDPIVWNDYGTYHRLLFDASACGPAVPKWPGPISANSSGDLADFRVGGVLQSKLHCVLEQMVADNPGMGGWFIDDTGSRSWFPNINWSTFPDRQAYRDGAVAVAQAVRDVADEHGLVFLVNGTWEKGTLASAGGGYPDMNADGLSLADGGVVEHHDGQSSFFGPYGCGAQWATASQVTHGDAFMFDISTSSAGVSEYDGTGCYAWIANQTSAQYDGVAPWSTTRWHENGLP